MSKSTNIDELAGKVYDALERKFGEEVVTNWGRMTIQDWTQELFNQGVTSVRTIVKDIAADYAEDLAHA